MKKSLIICTIFLLFGISSFAQIGVGIGSHGLNFRTNPDKNLGIILRTGFGFSGEPFETYFRPEAAFIKRHHYSEKTKLYAGFGVSGEFLFAIDQLGLGYGLLLPIGLEYFPLSSNKISISVESGLNFLSIGKPDRIFGNYGLIELTFYLDHHPD